MFLLTRWGGKRQISQMSPFDYLNAVTTGSIAAELATDLEQWYRPVTAMVVYGLVTWVVHFTACRSIFMRSLWSGRSLVLMESGTIFKENLSRASIDLNEFLGQARVAGYFDPNEIQTAILETNGQISFLPKSGSRPVTPQDLGLTVQPEKPCVCVVMDGHVLADNLKATGNDGVWLRRELAAQKAGRLEDVFLATVNAQNQLTVFERTGRQIKREFFE